MEKTCFDWERACANSQDGGKLCSAVHAEFPDLTTDSRCVQADWRVSAERKES